MGIAPLLPYNESEKGLLRIPADFARTLALVPHIEQTQNNFAGQPGKPLRNDELFAGWQQKGYELGWRPFKTGSSYILAAKQAKGFDQFMGKRKVRTHQGIKKLVRIKDPLQKLIQGKSAQRNTVTDHTQHKLNQQQEFQKLDGNSNQRQFPQKESQTIVPPRQSKTNGQSHSH